MPLKSGGERIKITYIVNKGTDQKIRDLAKQTFRPVGQMLDKIVAEYELKNDN